MAEEQIKITVGADTSQLNAELTKAQNNLKLFQAALAKSTNVKEIEYLQRSISGLEKQIGSLSGQMSGKLSSASGQATTTLTNLNRVVQDAPYGFIGIANNINPLVESFGRLKAETGSTGGALSALVSSLSGPGGLGIAFAAITSAITFAQMGFSAWTRGSKEASNDTDNFKGRLAELTKELNYTTQALDDFVAKAETASKINDINIQARFSDKTEQGVLTRQAKFITISEELVKASEERGKAYENLANITRSAFKTEDEYNQANSAALKIYNDLIKKENDLIDARQEQAAANRLATIEDQRAADEAAKAAAKKKKAAQDAKDTIEKTLAKLREDLRDQAVIQIELNKSTLGEQINLVDGAIRKLISDFNINPDDTRFIKIKAQLQELTKKQFKNDVLNLITTTQDKVSELTISPDYNSESIKEQIKLTKSAIDKLKELETSAGLTADPIFLQDLNNELLRFQNNLKNTQIQDVFKDLQIKLNLSTLDQQINLIDSAIKKLVTDYNVSPTDERIIKLQLQLDTLKGQKAIEEQTKKQIDSLNGILTSTAQDIAINFGETLGAALSGTASIGDFFSGLFAQIGKGLQAFGKYMIQTAIKIELIKKSIFSNTALAIAGGIALIAIGSLLANQYKKQAFAVGTNYAPGGMALVGERGPEMVSLPRGARVTPAAQTAQMMGGAMQQVEVFGVLRGQDIYFSNKKYSQTYRRTT